MEARGPEGLRPTMGSNPVPDLNYDTSRLSERETSLTKVAGSSPEGTKGSTRVFIGGRPTGLPARPHFIHPARDKSNTKQVVQFDHDTRELGGGNAID